MASMAMAMKRVHESATGERKGWAIKGQWGWWNFDIYSTREAAMQAWRDHVGHGSDPQIVRAKLVIMETDT